ncbi:hypothetical protein ACJX0J_013657, partial [Zea mays]
FPTSSMITHHKHIDELSLRTFEVLLAHYNVFLKNLETMQSGSCVGSMLGTQHGSTKSLWTFVEVHVVKQHQSARSKTGLGCIFSTSSKVDLFTCMLKGSLSALKVQAIFYRIFIGIGKEKQKHKRKLWASQDG